MEQTAAADITTIGQISAVPAILQVIREMTGMRFAAVAHVTEDSWTACAVLDQLDFGLKVGGELDVVTTLCHEIRAAHVSVVIDKASEDPLYRDHHTPRLYQFESYISVPVFRTDGRFFGTICALDPKPAELKSSAIQSTMESFARLLSLQIEAEETLQLTEAALHKERQTAELREQFIAVLGHDLRNPLHCQPDCPVPRRTPACGVHRPTRHAVYLQLVASGLSRRTSSRIILTRSSVKSLHSTARINRAGCCWRLRCAAHCPGWCWQCW
jgi:GAF domain-containing protein